MVEQKLEDIKKGQPDLYHVAFQKGTEPAFSGKLNYYHGDGMFHCAVCGQALFSGKTKFDSGTGWPSFTEPVSPEAIKTAPDNSFGLSRVEVMCGKCEAHLGHVFNDGPKKNEDGTAATGKRYCLNSVCLLVEEE